MAGGTDWVAVDWGTSNVRAWGIDREGRQTFAASSDKGMSRIGRDDYPAVLDQLLGAEVAGPVEVLICGMAGARQGWREAPYLDTPTALAGLARGAVRPEGADSRYDIRILPGICQRGAGHEDVMRGEETQLLGFLAGRPGFEGAVILPGTHSKWAEIRDGRLLRFSTAMTGELYEVLSQHSVLRHAFNGAVAATETEQGIAEGVAAGVERPDLLPSTLFRVRAAALVADKGPGWCAGYLSGLLVGTEIGGHRDWLAGGPVPLIGSARFGQLYAAALAAIGLTGEPIDATDITLAGLREARLSA